MLTGYDVSYSAVQSAGGEQWLTLTVKRPVSAVTVGNLSLFVTYKFRVRSVNSVGVSRYSRLVTLYTQLGLSAFSPSLRLVTSLHTLHTAWSLYLLSTSHTSDEPSRSTLSLVSLPSLHLSH